MISKEQNNLIAAMITLGSAHGVVPVVVPKAAVFSRVRKTQLSTHERQNLISLLSQAHTFHGAHHYRDSEDDYERNLWAMRNEELSAKLEELKTDRQARRVLDTLIDVECWLSESHAFAIADKELGRAITNLSKRIHREVASYYSQMT